MNKSLVAIVILVIINIALLRVFVTVNHDNGVLTEQLKQSKATAQHNKDLYDTEHKVIMENKKIDKEVKEDIQHAIDIIERAYDGTINPYQ